MDYVIEDADYCDKHEINFMGTECHQCEQDAVIAQSTDNCASNTDNNLSPCPLLFNVFGPFQSIYCNKCMLITSNLATLEKCNRRLQNNLKSRYKKS